MRMATCSHIGMASAGLPVATFSHTAGMTSVVLPAGTVTWTENMHGGYYGSISGASVFNLPDDAIRGFLRDLWTAFRADTPIYVSGSYVLWCLRGRPAAWTPDDIDVYLTREAPGPVMRVRAWVAERVASGACTRVNDDASDVKIDVKFPLPNGKRPRDDLPRRVSLIFHRARDAVPLFDLSALCMYIPVVALYEATMNVLHFFDTRDLEDVRDMRARTHPAFVERPATARADTPEQVRNLLLDHGQRNWVYARMAKYERRGFRLVAETDAPRAARFMSSLTWYHRLKELHPRTARADNNGPTHANNAPE